MTSDPVPPVGVFLAGVQKGGTTTLFGYLAEHPQLWPPSRKELHFFDDETMDWSNPDYSRLHAYFQHDRPAGKRLDATPSYVFWPTAPARIHDYHPGAQLIILFRDPIERAWSHWSMEIARSAEVLSFSEAIREGRQRLDGLSPVAPQQLRFTYVERGLYCRQVERLLELFPRSQLLFLRSDDLLVSPQKVLGIIATFLGLAPFPVVPTRRDHRNPLGDRLRPGTEDISYLQRLFRKDLMDFADLTGLDVSDWLTMRAVDSLTDQGASR